VLCQDEIVLAVEIVAFEAEKMREVSKAEFLSVWAPA
jgi:hypothetical protein